MCNRTCLNGSFFSTKRKFPRVNLIKADEVICRQFHFLACDFVGMFESFATDYFYGTTPGFEAEKNVVK